MSDHNNPAMDQRPTERPAAKFEQAHTPGPWVVGKPYNWHGHGFLPVGPTHAQANGDVTRQLAAVCPSDDRRSCVHWSDEDSANAHLIAAAPELLEMTKLLERTLVYEIKKSDLEDDDEGARLKFFTLVQVRAAIAKAEGRS